MYIDTRIPENPYGGRVSIFVPSADEMKQNPHACARLWALTQKERDEVRQKHVEE